MEQRSHTNGPWARTTQKRYLGGRTNFKKQNKKPLKNQRSLFKNMVFFFSRKLGPDDIMSAFPVQEYLEIE